MAVVLRTDIGMGKGKMCAQASHAAVMAYKLATCGTAEQKSGANSWEREGQAKVVLKVTSEEVLHELASDATEAGLIVALVRDAGHTQVDPGTVTALAIGPGKAKDIDEITGKLKLL